MRRRKVLKTLIVGGFAAAMIHPKSRQKIICTGKKGFEAYKSVMFKLSERKDLNEKERATFRARLNFSSKEEEDEFVREFLKDFQETRIQNQTFFKRQITSQELMKHIVKLSQKRREFAKERLRQTSFEGKRYTREEVSRTLIRYFELNKQDHRVPSEIEIRDMIDTGVEYR